MPLNSVSFSALLFSSLSKRLYQESFKSAHREDDKHFTRQRVLNFVDLVMIQLRRLVHNLNIEIEQFLTWLSSPDSYSQQAFSKARKKLKYTAFVALNDQFVSEYYQKADFLKRFLDTYTLLAVDGSMIQMPNSSSLGAYFGHSKNGKGTGMVQGRASLIYDALNRVVLDARLVPKSQGETTIFRQQYRDLIQEAFFKHLKPLFLMDRGYPSFELCKELDVAGHAFVIRAKSNFCNELKAFIQEDRDEKMLYLSPRSWDQKGKAQASKYKEGLDVRVVRILLPSGKYEYLLSNTDFEAETLSQLYQLRWGIETFYGWLKGPMQLENFSSKTKAGVLQDFHATILTANLSQLLIQEAQQDLEEERREEASTQKYQYQINQSTALGFLRDKIPQLLSRPENLAEQLNELREKIKKYKIPIKPGRNLPRNKAKGKRSRKKYHMNQRKPF